MVTVVMMTPDGVPVLRRERLVAASTGGAPPVALGATLGVMRGRSPFLCSKSPGKEGAAGPMGYGRVPAYPER